MNHEPTLFNKRARLENIILHDGTSILLNVSGADPVYVVGYYADCRGFNVCTTLKKVDVRAIKLRIQITEPEREQMARALTFDQKERDYRAAF